MSKKVKLDVTMVSEYGGHSCKSNSNVDLTLLQEYGELTKALQIVPMMNADVKVMVKIPGSKAGSVGTFMLKQIIVDGDGQSKIKLNSDIDSVELETLNALVQQEKFQIRCLATVELEENGPDGDWSDE